MASSVRSTALLRGLSRDRVCYRAFDRVPTSLPFHTTGQRNLLPPPPQVIQGTVNDPVAVPAAHPAHGSYHWTFERLLAAGLVPLSIAPFAAGTLSPTTDALLCAGVLIHAHMGLQTILTDYIPARRLPRTKRAAVWLLRAATVIVGIGLFEYETNDVGLTEGIRRIWKA